MLDTKLNEKWVCWLREYLTPNLEEQALAVMTLCDGNLLYSSERLFQDGTLTVNIYHEYIHIVSGLTQAAAKW